MRLYLLRHALAVPHGTPGFRNDADRPLTREGQTQARQVAEGLRRLKLEPELILTSPCRRAVQTAEAAARALGTRLDELPELRPGTPPSATTLALKPFTGRGDLLLVGHEPHLSDWLAELVAGPSGLRCVLKKGGAACVEVERVLPPAAAGTLRWLLMPKQLSLIGKAA